VWIFQLKEDLEKTAQKLDDYKPYNILPFEAPGVVNRFQNSPEVGTVIQVVILMDMSSLPGVFVSRVCLLINLCPN
jgi:hypothetical protein